MQLLVDEFVLTGKPDHGGLKYLFNRYRSPYANIPSARPTSGIALLFLHSLNSHKEIWEPVIEGIFEAQKDGGNSKTVNVLEAWSMDSPNHGHATKLNEETLLKHPKIIDIASCSEGLKMLLGSGFIGGDNVVGIGHSAGAPCIVVAADGYPLNHLPYSSIILVEPPMMTRPILNKMLGHSESELNLLQMVTKAIMTKKNIWSSREEAQQWLAKRYPWKKWDQRALKLFIDHGLRDLPTAAYPDHQGVTLACTREQELIGYTQFEGAIRSLELLSAFCSVIPVHCVIGTRPDLIPDETREGIWDASEGRKMASITAIEDAGHLVVQERPDIIASTILTLLERSASAKRDSRL